MKQLLLLIALMTAGMAASAQKKEPVANQFVTVKNCDIIWSKDYTSSKTTAQILSTIKIEGLFEAVDTASGIVFGSLKPFKLSFDKATVGWAPIWVIDPITAIVQIRQTDGGYNVIAKKIKSVPEKYKGEVANLPEANLMNNYALKNCEFMKAFVKQGCTDILDDGFNRKISEVFEKINIFPN